jgi:hypothetical protein
METAVKELLVNMLMETFPCLRSEIEDELSDFNEIYLHLVFGNVFNPYLLALFDEPANNRAELIKAGALVEVMSNMELYVQEVVVATILERLTDFPDKLAEFIEFAGPMTRHFIDELQL